MEKDTKKLIDEVFNEIEQQKINEQEIVASPTPDVVKQSDAPTTPDPISSTPISPQEALDRTSVALATLADNKQNKLTVNQVNVINGVPVTQAEKDSWEEASIASSSTVITHDPSSDTIRRIELRALTDDLVGKSYLTKIAKDKQDVLTTDQLSVVNALPFTSAVKTVYDAIGNVTVVEPNITGVGTTNTKLKDFNGTITSKEYVDDAIAGVGVPASITTDLAQLKSVKVSKPGTNNTIEQVDLSSLTSADSIVNKNYVDVAVGNKQESLTAAQLDILNGAKVTAAEKTTWNSKANGNLRVKPQNPGYLSLSEMDGVTDDHVLVTQKYVDTIKSTIDTSLDGKVDETVKFQRDTTHEVTLGDIVDTDIVVSKAYTDSDTFAAASFNRVSDSTLKTKLNALGIVTGDGSGNIDLSHLASDDLSNVADATLLTKGATAGLAKKDLSNITASVFKAVGVGAGLQAAIPTATTDAWTAKQNALTTDQLSVVNAKPFTENNLGDLEGLKAIEVWTSEISSNGAMAQTTWTLGDLNSDTSDSSNTHPGVLYTGLHIDNLLLGKQAKLTDQQIELLNGAKVTQAEKTTWNNKQNALTLQQFDVTNGNKYSDSEKAKVDSIGYISLIGKSGNALFAAMQMGKGYIVPVPSSLGFSSFSGIATWGDANAMYLAGVGIDGNAQTFNVAIEVNNQGVISKSNVNPSLGKPSGYVDNGWAILNIAHPISPNNATTKKYVDDNLNGKQNTLSVSQLAVVNGQSVTAAEKSTWNAKQDSIPAATMTAWTNKQNALTAAQLAVVNGAAVSEADKTSWNAKQGALSTSQLAIINGTKFDPTKNSDKLVSNKNGTGDAYLAEGYTGGVVKIAEGTTNVEIGKSATEVKILSEDFVVQAPRKIILSADEGDASKISTGYGNNLKSKTFDEIIGSVNDVNSIKANKVQLDDTHEITIGDLVETDHLVGKGYVDSATFATSAFARIPDSDLKTKLNSLGIITGTGGAVDLSHLASDTLSNVTAANFLTKAMVAGLAKKDLSNVTAATLLSAGTTAGLQPALSTAQKTVIDGVALSQAEKDKWNAYATSKQDALSAAQVSVLNGQAVTADEKTAWNAKASGSLKVNVFGGDGTQKADISTMDGSDGNKMLITASRANEIAAYYPTTIKVKNSTNANVGANTMDGSTTDKTLPTIHYITQALFGSNWSDSLHSNLYDSYALLSNQVGTAGSNAYLGKGYLGTFFLAKDAAALHIEPTTTMIMSASQMELKGGVANSKISYDNNGIIVSASFKEIIDTAKNGNSSAVIDKISKVKVQGYGSYSDALGQTTATLASKEYADGLVEHKQDTLTKTFTFHFDDGSWENFKAG